MVAFITVLEVLGIFVIVPIIIGLIIISLVMIIEQAKHKAPGKLTGKIANLVCAIDTDCPEGYVCINGKCVPQTS